MQTTHTPSESFERLEHEKHIVLSFYQAFSQNKPDQIDALLDANWKDIPLAPGQVDGPDGIKPIMADFKSAFPDVSVHVHHVVQQEGQVAVRAEITGTHLGPIFGIPATGKKVSFRLHEFHTLNANRITSTWHMEDWFGLFQQLGQFPA